MSPNFIVRQDFYLYNELPISDLQTMYTPNHELAKIGRIANVLQTTKITKQIKMDITHPYAIDDGVNSVYKKEG